MGQELKQRSKTTAKTHEEIMSIIQDIKTFEQKYKEYDLPEVAVSETIEEVLVEFEPVAQEMPTEPIFLEVPELEKTSQLEIVEALEKEQKKLKAKPTQDTVFKLRFDGTGNLEMLGVKKHPVKQSKPKIKRKEKTDSKEQKSKTLKLKGGISKIKNIIPRRGKNKEETKKQESPKFE